MYKTHDKRICETYSDRCIIGDIRDKNKLQDALRGADVVYHLAAEHKDNVKPVSLYYDVNVGGAKEIRLPYFFFLILLRIEELFCHLYYYMPYKGDL